MVALDPFLETAANLLDRGTPQVCGEAQQTLDAEDSKVAGGSLPRLPGKILISDQVGRAALTYWVDEAGRSRPCPSGSGEDGRGPATRDRETLMSQFARGRLALCNFPKQEEAGGFGRRMGVDYRDFRISRGVLRQDPGT